MKKVFMTILMVTCCFMLSGCGDDKLDPANMTKEEIIGELKLINNNLINVWNDSLVMISWYTVEGSDQDGKAIDIDNVISKLKFYYEDFDEYEAFIQSLNDSYQSVQESWKQVYQELKLIYEAVLKTKPQQGVVVEYKTNIDLYDEYQTLFNNAIDQLSEQKKEES